MANRQPTIEQNSHFTSKTKEGQNVEFEATLRFYITPSGEVSLSVPGGQQPSKSAAPQPIRDSKPSEPISKEPSVDTPHGDKSDKGQNKTNIQAGRGAVNEQDQRGKKLLTDETIEKAFPRGPESSECSIKQFIPDPCKAVDDAVRSIKSVYHRFISGPKCPPPENTDNLKIEKVSLLEKPEIEYRENSKEMIDNEENENVEMMENEQKYEM